MPVDQAPRRGLAGRARRARGQERLSGADGSGNARAGPPSSPSLPGFDVVVSTSESDDVLQVEAEMLNDGKTMLVTVGKKGKCVGLGRFLSQRIDAAAVSARDLEQAVRRSRTAHEGADPGRLSRDPQAAGVVENFVRRDFVNGAPGAELRGRRDLQGMPSQHVQFWSTTKHAQAFELAWSTPSRTRFSTPSASVPHDRFRVQLGLGVGSRNTAPDRQSVRELPWARLETRGRAR